MLTCGERKAMVMAPPRTYDSAVLPCFHGCPVFLTGISHYDLLPHIPLIRLSVVNSSLHPGIAPQSLNSSSQPLCCLGYVWLWKDCLIFIPIRLHRSAVSPSALNVSPLTQTIAWCGDQTATSVPPPAEGRSSPTNTPVFPASSFILPSFAWVYIFFSTGQVLLSALSLCSLCTSKSDSVFLMYPWREMCSASTYFLYHLILWQSIYFFFFHVEQ